MVEFTYKDSYTVEDLREIVRLLRAPGGCPWDIRQTHESIRRNFLEEVYEVVEAIDEGSPEHLREELGDVLLQVLFHASLEEDAGRFDLDDVADGICKKLIFRHPHVFPAQDTGETTAPGGWEDLKRREKHQETHTQVLESVARSLPGLWRAEKIQTKAARSGFEWPDVDAALDKVAEECAELRTAVAEQSNIEEELGDLLFAAVKVGRFCGIDPETAMAGACEKFIRRFARVEARAAESGRRVEEVSREELIRYWNEEKHRGEPNG